MTDKRKQLIMYYAKVFKNFRIPVEIQDTLINLFGHEMWSRIYKIIKSRGVFRKSELPWIISFSFQDVTTEYLESKLLHLQLSDVALHSDKRKWNTFQLCGKRNTTFLSARGLMNEFLASFKKLNMQYDVKIKMYREIVWIGLSNSDAKRNAPIFLAHFLGEDVILSNRRDVNGNLMKAVTTALKCEALKKVNLDGYDVWSLFKMMKQKGSNAIEAVRRKGNLENIDPGPLTGVDYSRGKIRKAAMEECLGKDPPILNTITIKSDSGLRVKRWLPEMEGYRAKATLKIFHPNMPEFLKEMAERNILVEPLPQYLKAIPLTGKNTIYLKDPTLRK